MRATLSTYLTCFALLLLAFLMACSGSPTASPARTTDPVPPVETSRPPTQTPLPPTASPAPDGPTPTPDLAAMTVNVLTSTSPDGLWKAEALLADPYNPRDGFIGDFDFARLTIFRLDDSLLWMPYEEWSPTGLGDSYLSRFYWTPDGRYLYFTHAGAAGGCGDPFVTHLRRVDLTDGSLHEIPLSDLGLDLITISPDVRRMAYRTAEGFLVYDLEAEEASTFSYPWPEEPNFRVDGYAWSPDDQQLAFTMLEGYCGPPGERTSSIGTLALDSGIARMVTQHDARNLIVSGWSESDALEVQQGDKSFSLALDSGELTPLPDSASDSLAEATGILRLFFDSLYWGSSDFFSHLTYERAAELYGGDYEVLQEQNPQTDPEDHASLLRNACEVNGFQCLRIREVLAAEVVDGTEGTVQITIHFMNPDGSIFVLGPCCGDEPTGESQETFVFTVERQEDGTVRVLELPPYVP